MKPRWRLHHPQGQAAFELLSEVREWVANDLLTRAEALLRDMRTGNDTGDEAALISELLEARSVLSLNDGAWLRVSGLEYRVIWEGPLPASDDEIEAIEAAALRGFTKPDDVLAVISRVRRPLVLPDREALVNALDVDYDLQPNFLARQAEAVLDLLQRGGRVRTDAAL